MSDDRTKIEWTTYTFNPWWGCTKVSAGCKNCYAETFDARFKGEHWGDKSNRKFFGQKHWNQEQADKRIPHLMAARWPAIRFVSYEPALEEVNFDPPYCECNARYGRDVQLGDDGATPFCGHCRSEMGFGAWLDPLNGGIDWVIAGAESGHNARPMNEDWVRAVRDQCSTHGVSFFYKQRVENGMKISLPLLDGISHAEFPAPRSTG